jgi:hypothetical protein
MKQPKINSFLWCYERFPSFIGKDKQTVRKLNSRDENLFDEKIGSIVKEVTDKSSDKLYTGRTFKLIKIRKQFFDKQDLVGYKKDCFYVRVKSDYVTGEVVLRELWVLHNDENKI